MTARWQRIHVYYYDSNKDTLLLDCIQPLFATLHQHGWTERAYFTRHWSGGSHLRLHLYAEDERFQREIAPYVKQEVEAYLQYAPSRYTFSETEARKQFERRARMASYTSPVYEPLRPDNSVEVNCYDEAAMAKTIGSEGAAHLLEDYYTETNPLAFSLLAQTRNNYTARLNRCFDLLLAIAATSPHLPLSRAYMSYRSHAEAYIICEPLIEEPRVRRQRLDAAYQQRRSAIGQRTLRLLRQIQQGDESLPDCLASFIEVHRRYSERAYHGAVDGTIRLKTSEEVMEEEDRSLPLEESAFHMAARQNSRVMAATNEPLLIGHRVNLNFLYLQLNRMGMLNEDRYILDYYIASIVEELLKIDPVAAIRGTGMTPVAS